MCHNVDLEKDADGHDLIDYYADSSKIGFANFGCICKIDEVDILITDSNIRPEQKKELESYGVKVITV